MEGIPDWVLGAILATVAAIVSNLGLNLQKLAHLRLQRKQPQDPPHGCSGKRMIDDLEAKGVVTTLLPKVTRGSWEGANVPVNSAPSVPSTMKTQRDLVCTAVPAVVGEKVSSGGTDVEAWAASTVEVSGVAIDPMVPSLNHAALTDVRKESDLDRRPLLSKPQKSDRGQPCSSSSSVPCTVGGPMSAPSSSSAAPRARASSKYLSSEGVIRAMKNESPDSNYAKDGIWIAGMGLVVFGSVFDFVALRFAATSIVAPLGSLTVVANAVFSPVLLGEKLGTRDLVAAFVIVTGAAVSVASAPHDEFAFSEPQDVFDRFTRLAFLVYITGIISLLVMLWFAMSAFKNLGATLGPRRKMFGVQDGALYTPRARALHRLVLAASSGIWGGQSVLFAKCVATVLPMKGALLMYETYIILFGLFLTIFMQIRTLNSALERFAALSTVPIFQAFWIISSVLAGLVFFGEWVKMLDTHSWMSVIFVFGVLLTVFGVSLVHRGTSGHAASRRESELCAADRRSTSRGSSTDGFLRLASTNDDDVVIGSGECRDGNCIGSINHSVAGPTQGPLHPSRRPQGVSSEQRRLSWLQGKPAAAFVTERLAPPIR